MLKYQLDQLFLCSGNLTIINLCDISKFGKFNFLFNYFFQPAKCANQIEDVCVQIEKTINQTIQNALNTLEKDCEKIAGLVDHKLAVNA